MSGGSGGVPGGSGGVPGGVGAASDAGTGPVVLPPTVQPRPYVDVEKTVSSCAESGGTPFLPASDAESASLLLGRWQLCSGALPNDFQPGGAGLEFDRDRRWRTLLRTPQGGLTPATGFDSEGAWYLASEDPRDMLFANKDVLRMTFASRGGNHGFPIEFLKNPTRLRISSYAVYAWLGE